MLIVMVKVNRVSSLTNKLSFKLVRFAFFLLAFLVLGSLVTTKIVLAADNAAGGPNIDWFGSTGSSIRYVLESDNQVKGAGSLTVPVYYLNGDPSTPPPTITVKTGDLNAGYSGTASAACLTKATGIAAGTNCSGGCTINSGTTNLGCTVALAASDFTYSADIGGWASKVGLHLKKANGGASANELELRLGVNNGAIIGYSASNGKSFAVAHTYGAGDYYNYSIPFGTACSYSGTGTRDIRIYDGDVGNNGIQPLNFEINLVDTTTGATVFAHNYTTTGSIPDELSKNNGNQAYEFTPVLNHDYVLQINHVYSHNTLQFSLPFDSIYAQTTCSYVLTPSITVTPATAEGGSNVTVDPSVNNSGSVASTDTQWQLTTMAYKSPLTPPAAANSTSSPCTYFAGTGAVGCSVLVSGKGSFATGTDASYTGTGSFGPLTTVLSDAYPAGTKVCFALSVQPHTSTDTKWAHSAPACVVVGKKPKLNVTGGDIIVGRAFASTTTSTPTANIKTGITTKIVGATTQSFGSWGEYGAFASGNITGFGSGSAFSPPGLTGLGVGDICSYSTLSFTNAGTKTSCTANQASGGNIGSYVTNKTIPDVASAFPATANLGTSPTINLATIAAGTYSAAGNVTINGGKIPLGKTVIINAPNANVTIISDIIYATDGASQDPGLTFKSLQDIPQVVIIANNIIIDDSGSHIVKQVDAWLIAKTSLNTCDTTGITTNLSTTICSDVLTVNGPVMAGKIYPNRTAGAGPGAATGDPGEAFNLRPDAYLWAYEQSIQTGRLQSVYSVELPPRF